MSCTNLTFQIERRLSLNVVFHAKGSVGERPPHCGVHVCIQGEVKKKARQEDALNKLLPQPSSLHISFYS